MPLRLAPTAMETFTVSVTGFTDIATTLAKNLLVAGNAAICADSLSITSRAALNFSYAPHPVAKVFF